jgi:small subunit ribosomal protein S16
MVVKIRLARFGKANAPFYNIVVAQARYVLPLPDANHLTSSQGARATANLSRSSVRHHLPSLNQLQQISNTKTGTYDPIPKPPPFGEGKPFKDIKLDITRAKYWLGVGAQPSDPAWRLMAMVRPTFYEEGLKPWLSSLDDRLGFWSRNIVFSKLSSSGR